MIYLLALLCVLIAGAFLRLRLWSGNLLGRDTWGYLLEVKEFKKQRKVPDSIPAYSIKSEFDTPPLFFLILSFIPNLEKNAKYISIFFDTLNAALIAAFVWLISGNAQASVISAALFAITPSSTVEALTLNARPFASLLFSCFAVFMVEFAALGSPWAFIGATIAAFLILMTHKFTAQACLITSIGLALYFGNIFFVLPFILAFVIALESAHYQKILLGHITVLLFWFKNIDKRRAMGGFRSTAQSLLKLAFNPWILLAFAASGNPALFAMALSLVLAAIITAFRPFAFLGENHRYLESASLPVFALASLFITSIHLYPPSPLPSPSHLGVVLIMAPVFAVICPIILFFYHKQLNDEPDVEDDFLDAVRALRKSKRDVVLCVPNVYYAPVALLSGKKIFGTSSPIEMMSDHSRMLFLLFGRKSVVPKLVSKYGIGLVLVKRSENESKWESIWFKKYENDSFILYETTKVKK